jgi:hypothetical protein
VKQVGSDLSLLERRDVRPARQEAGEIGLSHRQRQAAQVVAVSAMMSAARSAPSTIASPSITNCL